MPLDALRGWIRALRDERAKTQADVAAHIGMPLTTYKEWETGKTSDIKAMPLIRLARYLGGDLNEFAKLPDTATAEDGEHLARQRTIVAFAPTPDETPEEPVQFNRLLDLLEQGVPPEEAARRVRRAE